MTKRLVIGVMTGNSMDAVDVVLSEFDGDKMRDVCSLSMPYSVAEKTKMDGLRSFVCQNRPPRSELLHNENFLEVHNEYVKGVAKAINLLLSQNNIDKSTVDAIGFHGKTLDHNPPSSANKSGVPCYTTQLGSAQMLADLTGIPVVHDFRSKLLQNGFEGAPLAGPHNAKIAKTEGNGCYFNAGNTSNLAFIEDGNLKLSFDAGPFNEYIDNFILRYKNETMDVDAHYGLQGKIMPQLVQYLFECGKDYYEMLPPKSGDPAFYKTAEVFAYVEQKFGNPKDDEQLFCDVMATFEYFAAYVAAYAVISALKSEIVTQNFYLFGGGWKNPLCYDGFVKLLSGEGYILPQHENDFEMLRQRVKKAEITYSNYGTYMEARLMADLAYCCLENKNWELPELNAENKKMVLGFIRYPHQGVVDDCLSRAAFGWQLENKEEK